MLKNWEVNLMRAKLTLGAIVLAGLAVLWLPSPVRAHHAFAAEFDANKPVKFENATVTKVELINPHSWIHVDVKQTRWYGGELGDRSGEPEHPAEAGHHQGYGQAGRQD